MIAHPGLLIEPAKKAGIPVPPDVDNFDPEAFKAFHIFCCVQLGASMPSWDAHWENAKLIAALSPEELDTITFAQLVERGLGVRRS